MINPLRRLIQSINAGLTELRSTLTRRWIQLKYPHVQLGANVRFYGPIQLNIARTAIVRIGDNVVFRSLTRYNYVGINRPVSLYVSPGATLEIGDGCGFSGTAIVANRMIVIEPYCLFGGNASVWDTDFHPLDHRLRRVQTEGTRVAPVRIGADVFIGANALILKGVTIGARAIVGAGSVVTRSVPSDQIWAGNPARFIREHPRPDVAVPGGLATAETVVW